MDNSISFNKPCVVDKSEEYLIDVLHSGKLSGNGDYTKKCHSFFENKYGFSKVLLTTSGTDALEMAALLIDAKEGDEIIVPSYTFVSSALAFTRQGARIVFADSEENTPNLDISKLETLITPSSLWWSCSGYGATFGISKKTSSVRHRRRSSSHRFILQRKISWCLRRFGMFFFS